MIQPPWRCPTADLRTRAHGCSSPSVVGSKKLPAVDCRENKDCMFIGTNPDAVTHLTDAQEWAGNGSMVGAIRGSTKREPIIVGKPNGFMLDNIASKVRLWRVGF